MADPNVYSNLCSESLWLVSILFLLDKGVSFSFSY